MDSCFSGNSNRGATTITSLHTDIIKTHILKKLDAQTLAATSCVSPQLHTLCCEENLWKNICNTTFPSTSDPRVQNIISSFSSGHRSFFADSFPTIDDQYHHQSKPKREKGKGTEELISLVDVHCCDQLVYSKVVVNETLTGWFTSSPFRIDLVDRKEFVPLPMKYDGVESEVMKTFEHELKLSWIIIDPTKKRAINLSSQSPVEVRRHWLTGDIEVRYVTVASGTGVKYSVKVTCGGKEGGELFVREISMQVEDREGKVMKGKDSLVNLHEAMEGERVKREIGNEKKRYENYKEMRKFWRENKVKRERTLDMVCMWSGLIIFIVFLTMILSR